MESHDKDDTLTACQLKDSRIISYSHWYGFYLFKVEHSRLFVYTAK